MRSENPLQRVATLSAHLPRGHRPGQLPYPQRRFAHSLHGYPVLALLQVSQCGDSYHAAIFADLLRYMLLIGDSLHLHIAN